MNKICIVRVGQGKNTTLSHLYISGIFCAYLLEDRLSSIKIAGETCIPEGEYELQLNTTAGMNRRYAKRFLLFHRGMLEIVGISGFRLVFIHIGNFHQDTKGCPLTGHYWDFKNGDYEVSQSELSYLKVYRSLCKALQNGIHQIVVVNKIRKGASDHAA